MKILKKYSREWKEHFLDSRSKDNNIFTILWTFSTKA